MKKIEFCHIAPIKHILHAAAHSTKHMALAHLCSDPEYVRAFRTIGMEPDNYIYLDNSQFELGTALPFKDLIETAHLILADCIILPDGELEGLEECKDAGFDVMYIPSAPDLEEDFLATINDPDIDYIGLSYSKTSSHLGRPRHSATSRYDFLSNLGEMLPNKKIHMLGMVTPGEIALVKPFEDAIVSWDSSIAIWAGINEIIVKEMRHKNTDIVDFNSVLNWSYECNVNIAYINKLLELWEIKYFI